MRRYIANLIKSYDEAMTEQDKNDAKLEIMDEVRDLKREVREIENTIRSTTDREFIYYLSRQVEDLVDEITDLLDTIGE